MSQNNTVAAAPPKIGLGIDVDGAIAGAGSLIGRAAEFVGSRIGRAATNVFGGLVNNLIDLANPLAPPPKQNAYVAEEPYATRVESLDLFRTTPYGFYFKYNDRSYEFYLPINPTNLVIATQFANTVIPTLYGTVEERSEIKLYSISISGTTGTAPRNVRMIVGNDKEANERTGRAVNSTSVLTTLSNSVAELVPGAEAGLNRFNRGLNAVGGAISSVAGPSAPSGFNNANSGYAAFHNFYKFLHTYQKLVGSNSTANKHLIKLYFRNYKDGNQYVVSPQRFTLTRSADTPFLYNYSIEMTGYALTGIDKEAQLSTQELYDKRLRELGLDGVRSTTIRAMSNNIASSFSNLTKAFKAL